jgi:lipocalin
MNFEAAKALLIENAVGANNYSGLTKWSELAAAADFEKQCAKDRIL